MITKLAESITAFLIRKNYMEIKEKDIISYGMEIIVSTILGWTIILALGIICGNIFYSIIFAAVFLTLRSFTGGYHADTYLKCNTVLVTTFLISLLLENLLVCYCGLYTIEAAFLLSIYIICKYVPVEHPYKPLNDMQKRKSKIISILLCILFTGIENVFWTIGEKEISFMFLSVISVVMILILAGVKKKMRKEESSNGES